MPQNAKVKNYQFRSSYFWLRLGRESGAQKTDLTLVPAQIMMIRR
jgi:hypothetical protein